MDKKPKYLIILQDPDFENNLLVLESHVEILVAAERFIGITLDNPNRVVKLVAVLS